MCKCFVNIKNAILHMPYILRSLRWKHKLKPTEFRILLKYGVCRLIEKKSICVLLLPYAYIILHFGEYKIRIKTCRKRGFWKNWQVINILNMLFNLPKCFNLFKWCVGDTLLSCYSQGREQSAWIRECSWDCSKYCVKSFQMDISAHN